MSFVGKRETGPSPKGWPCSSSVVRRRPTLPQPLGCSTIGAERLNFRVRDGTGCFPFAMAAVTLVASHGPWGVHTGCGQVCHCSVVHPATGVAGWVDRGREPQCCRQGSLWVLLRVCVTIPRPISTSQLYLTVVHFWPINPVFCWGPYPVNPVGNLILKRASRLDAFSGYHFRT